MGLFDKLKNISDKVNEFLNDDSDDNDDDVSVIDMGTISPATNAQLYKNGVLSTPPPPPIPVTGERMSVNVAVNGKNYGPYERATLLNMIANGSLTPQTLVFMNGMSEWKPACEVPKVKELFSDRLTAPDIPPVPWAESTDSAPSHESIASTAEEENVLSPRLNRLIAAAVADGEISDMERQVLVRNAQEEGVAMDEFVMILEARLFEQRQILTARQKEMEHKHQMEKASVQAAAARIAEAPVARRENKKSITKCPHCGAPRKALATSCPECGYEYTHEMHEECSAWERLSQQLLDVDNEKAHTLVGKYLSLFDSSMMPGKIEKKKSIIKNFPLPSDKQGLFDFFVSCATIAAEGHFKNQLAGAYKTKAKQVLVKARVVMTDDQKLLNQLNEIAKKYNIKA